MHVGTLNFLVRRLSGDYRPLVQLYRDAIDLVVRTEKLGFDFALSGEHHFMPTQWNPSPLMVLAAVAQHTSRIRLGTLVLLTPFYEPVRLSEDLATLDILCNGRLDVAFGSGSIGFEFETFRVDPRERTGRMWETMEIVRRSFAEEEFDHQGKYFKIPHIRQTTKAPAGSVSDLVWGIRSQELGACRTRGLSPSGRSRCARRALLRRLKGQRSVGEGNERWLLGATAPRGRHRGGARRRA
jgi:alkanesulfonate monooxygenase SsuD/methylene tetrahydromethanopterin reductase-like flavin-dependent oxidoreductase (luciferase family)